MVGGGGLTINVTFVDTQVPLFTDVTVNVCDPCNVAAPTVTVNVYIVDAELVANEYTAGENVTLPGSADVHWYDNTASVEVAALVVGSVTEYVTEPPIPA